MYRSVIAVLVLIILLPLLLSIFILMCIVTVIRNTTISILTLDSQPIIDIKDDIFRSINGFLEANL